ncbi:membrane bound O-acyl transferase family-domain-containing protein, partial [Mycena sp. CBHHK59/15]
LVPLVIKPSPFHRLFFIPILALTYYVIFRTSTGALDTHYYLACSWLTYIFTASDYILLTDVQRELHQVPPSPSPPAPPPLATAPLGRHIAWGVDLFLSPRGVGWTHAPLSALPTPPRAGMPRAAFVARQLARAAGFFLLHDAAALHVRWNGVYRAHGVGLAGAGWAARTLGVAGWGLAAYSAMMLAWCVVSAAGAAVGLGAPERWVPLFGGPREAWSIRKFWGRAWHQLVRRFVSAHGKHLAHRVLHLQPGSNASSYVQLYTAFLISALIHYFAETMALRHWRGGALRFFLLQAGAITVEDFLVFLARKTPFVRAPRRVVWAAGYAWTLAWFTLSLPGWQDPLNAAGQMDKPLPVSVWMGLWRGEWVLGPVV